MRHLEFHSGELTVSSKGTTIKLLPKEFELLEYFYRHPNQIFTRSDLIYAVWQWSDSYERTVDDHVYRLRRKLAGWKHVELQTVRGRGYRLVLNDSAEKENPLSQDRQFQTGMDMMFQRFVQYGQGKGILSLKKQSDQLQIGWDARKRLYVLFITGQFQEMIDTRDCPFWERAFYLVYLYSLLQMDPKPVLSVYRQIIARDLLPSHFQEEVAKYSIIRPLMECGQKKEASQRIQQLIHDHGSSLFLCNAKLYLMLKENQDCTHLINEGQQLVHDTPYLREQGRFMLLKSIWERREEKAESARSNLELGLEILRASAILPSYMQGIRDLLFLSQPDGSLHTYMEQLWSELGEQYHFKMLLGKVERLIQASL